MGESIWGRVKYKVPKSWCWLEDDTSSSKFGLAVGSDWLDAASDRLRDLVLTAHSVEDYPCDMEKEIEYGEDADGEYAVIQITGNFNYGCASALSHLEEATIPYEAHDDPKYEFVGLNFWFDPIAGIDGERSADADSNTTIAGYELAPLLDDPVALYAFVRERLRFDHFDVAKCSIAHLHAIPYDEVDGVPMFIADKEDR